MGKSCFLKKISKRKGRKCCLSNPRISRDPGPDQIEQFLGEVCFYSAKGEGSFLGLQLGFRISSQSTVLNLNASDASDKKTPLYPSSEGRDPFSCWLQGEGAGGRGLGLLSLFQAPGQVTCRSSPGAQGPAVPSSQGRLLVLTARWAGLLQVRFRAATFFCFALIFCILAIEDKQRKPFSSPAVKTPLPFCWFPCLPFPLNPRQRKRCLDIPSYLSLS